MSFTQLLVSFGFVVAAVLFVRKKATARYTKSKPNLPKLFLDFFTSIPFTKLELHSRGSKNNVINSMFFLTFVALAIIQSCVRQPSVCL